MTMVLWTSHAEVRRGMRDVHVIYVVGKQTLVLHVVECRAIMHACYLASRYSLPAVTFDVTMHTCVPLPL